PLLIAFPPRGYRKTLVPGGVHFALHPARGRHVRHVGLGADLPRQRGSSADPEAVCHRTLVVDLPRPKDRTLGNDGVAVPARWRTVARLFQPSASSGARAMMRAKTSSAPARSRRSISWIPSRRSASTSELPDRCHIAHSSAAARAAASSSGPVSAFSPSASVMVPPSLRRVVAKGKMGAAMAARFSGKVVLITGGGAGIGRAAAERLASEGARVALVDVGPAALARSGAAAEKAGGEALTVYADVTRLDHVERYAEAA